MSRGKIKWCASHRQMRTGCNDQLKIGKERKNITERLSRNEIREKARKKRSTWADRMYLQIYGIE